MRIGFLIGKRATGDHGPIDFTKLSEGRALNGTEAAVFHVARGLAERGALVNVFCDAATADVAVCKELGGAGVWTGTDPRVHCDTWVAVSEPGLLKDLPGGQRILWHHLIDFPDGHDPVNVDAYVFVSRLHRQLMLDRCPPDRSIWLPNPVDLSMFTSKPRRPHTMAWASSPDRGLHRLLEIWPEIRERVPTASLRIYYRLDPFLDMWAGREGDSPFIQRANYIKRALEVFGRNGEHGITVMGPVSRRQFCEELSQTTLLPYIYDPIDQWSELFCSAVVDACAAGAAPLLSGIDVLGDNFANFASYIHGTPGKLKHAWVSQIVHMLTNEDFTRDVRQRCRPLAVALDYRRIAYVWEKFTDRGRGLCIPVGAEYLHEYASSTLDSMTSIVVTPGPVAGTYRGEIEVAKPKLVYVYGQPEPSTWRDGMWAAMKLLEADYDVTWVNAQLGEAPPTEGDHVLLAWGDFESPAERACRHLKARVKALQMGGMSAPMGPMLHWPLIFAETRWHQEHLRAHAQQHHCRTQILTAFGCNTGIYHKMEIAKRFQWITVGHWADWKRQHLFHNKPGFKIAVGERYATANPHQAPPIIEAHLRAGVIVAPYVSPEELAVLYNLSERCYIPASLVGGGERAVLEARACGIPVEIEPDNPKLRELLDGPVLSHHDFASSLREGLR